MGRILLALFGVCLAQAAILPAVMFASNQQSVGTISWWVLALVLMLASFEVLHLAFRPVGAPAILFLRGPFGIAADLAHIGLATGLLLATFPIQHASAWICGGGLGAGFPASFICDSSGSSPISDWGKMSWGDIPNPIGSLIDLLFFAALIWLVFVIATKGLDRIRQSPEQM